MSNSSEIGRLVVVAHCYGKCLARVGLGWELPVLVVFCCCLFVQKRKSVHFCDRHLSGTNRQGNWEAGTPSFRSIPIQIRFERREAGGAQWYGSGSDVLCADHS